MDRRILTGLIIVALSAGCRHEDSRPYVTWAEQPVQTVYQGSTAFKAYHDAAVKARVAAGDKADRTTFDAPQQRRMLAALSPALADVTRGSRTAEIGMQFQPGADSSPYAQEYRLLGKALSWRITNSLKDGKLDQAASDTLTATRFGFDLTSGDAALATLGLCIVDEARQAMVPGLDRLGDRQLGALAEGMRQALLRRPKLSQTFENERLQMRFQVQRVQDALRDRTLDKLGGELGPQASKAVVYLKGIQSKDRAREQYFEGFAREADEMARWWTDLSDQPALSRSEDKIAPPRLEDSRPWKRFSMQFFSAGEPLLKMYDATLARTRLLGMEAVVTRAERRQGFAPDSLPVVQGLSTDPYCGKPFVYRRRGRGFEVYSVGTDARDDGGQTDELFQGPDLTLESGA